MLVLADDAAEVSAASQWMADESTQRINESALRGHIRFLADDLLEGRGPGSRGDAITQLYIATQLQTLGFEPASADGTWTQTVPMIGVQTSAPPEVELVIRTDSDRPADDAKSVRWTTVDDAMWTIGRPVESVEVSEAPLVFVGYGIQAPQYDWDDFKDADLRGKILVVMNNDPSDDPDLFEGKRRLYYGRWDYKYESAARQGAAGAIIIHTTPSAGYPWQVVQTSWAGEEFELRGVEGPRLDVKAWATEDAVRRALDEAGVDLDRLRQSAQSRDFRPVELPISVSVGLSAKVREQTTANVLGRLPGSDPTLAPEHVVLMAHHDHLGIGTRDESGDAIYNGAVDNAAGTACLLSMAAAIAAADPPPRRSILVAAVGAEEQGLLGSKYMAADPPLPAGRMAALINMDGTNTIGPTHDVNVIGLGKSSMDALVSAAAAAQGRRVTPDHFPDRGYFYRSDQFSLAKIGVPAVYLHTGTAVRDRPAGWGEEQLNRWVKETYHQPSDEYDPKWDLRGAVEDTRLLYTVARLAAAADELPAWNPGDEFEAARREALAAGRAPTSSDVTPSQSESANSKGTTGSTP